MSKKHSRRKGVSKKHTRRKGVSKKHSGQRRVSKKHSRQRRVSKKHSRQRSGGGGDPSEQTPLSDTNPRPPEATRVSGRAQGIKENLSKFLRRGKWYEGKDDEQVARNAVAKAAWDEWRIKEDEKEKTLDEDDRQKWMTHNRPLGSNEHIMWADWQEKYGWRKREREEPNGTLDKKDMKEWQEEEKIMTFEEWQKTNGWREIAIAREKRYREREEAKEARGNR